MKNKSFSATTPQMRARTKSVTRRLGWDIPVGACFRAVEKQRGLKKGEHVTPIDVCRVLKVSDERLDATTTEEVTREGFPGHTPEWFIAMFCKLNRCLRDRVVKRVEFEFVEENK